MPTTFYAKCIVTRQRAAHTQIQYANARLRCDWQEVWLLGGPQCIWRFWPHQ